MKTKMQVGQQVIYVEFSGIFYETTVTEIDEYTYFVKANNIYYVTTEIEVSIETNRSINSMGRIFNTEKEYVELCYKLILQRMIKDNITNENTTIDLEDFEKQLKNIQSILTSKTVNQSYNDKQSFLTKKNSSFELQNVEGFNGNWLLKDFYNFKNLDMITIQRISDNAIKTISYGAFKLMINQNELRNKKDNILELSHQLTSKNALIYMPDFHTSWIIDNKVFVLEIDYNSSPELSLTIVNSVDEYIEDLSTQKEFKDILADGLLKGE